MGCSSARELIELTIAESREHSDIDNLKHVSFRATLTDRQTVAEFKDFTKGVYGLLTELVFDINADGIKLRQLDSSKACMVDAEFKSSFFTEYRFLPEKHGDVTVNEITVCVATDSFYRAVKKAKDGLELAICAMPDSYSKYKKEPRLEIVAISDLKQSEFLCVLTPPDTKTKKPKIDLEASLSISAETFSKVIGDVTKAKKNHLRFIMQARAAENERVGRVLQAGLTLFASDDEGEILYEFPQGDEVIWNFYIRSGKTQTTLYHLPYLNEAKNLFHKRDELKIHLSTNKPLRVECNTQAGKNISFIMAPRVEKR